MNLIVERKIGVSKYIPQRYLEKWITDGSLLYNSFADLSIPVIRKLELPLSMKMLLKDYDHSV